MPNYIYKARNETGKSIRGTMDAASKEELINKLHKMGYMTTKVTEAFPGINIDTIFDKIKKISTEDMIILYIQLSNLINAGITILSGLETLGKQIENKKLRETLGDVSRNVDAGDSLSQALARHPRVFPFIFVSMIKAGEASGKLGTILARYAIFTEQEQDLRQKIKGALFYPAILLIAGILVILFVMTFIIPQFSEIFMEAGIKLPLPTLILLKIGLGIKHFWYLIVLFTVLISQAARYYVKTQSGRLNFDRLKLEMPIIGSLNRKVAISRFARTLGLLVGSGVPILKSLDITREVTGNEVLARVIGNVRSAVEKGEMIAESLKVSEEFPDDAIQMIAVGEETGKIEEMLNKVSDFYDVSIGYTVKKLTTLIEPLFLVIMGGMVGFIMASLLLPIFDMVKILRH